MADKEMYK